MPTCRSNCGTFNRHTSVWKQCTGTIITFRRWHLFPPVITFCPPPVTRPLKCGRSPPVTVWKRLPATGNGYEWCGLMLTVQWWRHVPTITRSGFGIQIQKTAKYLLNESSLDEYLLWVNVGFIFRMSYANMNIPLSVLRGHRRRPLQLLMKPLALITRRGHTRVHS